MPTSKPIPRWIDAFWLGFLSLYIWQDRLSFQITATKATLIFMAQDFHEVYLYGNLRDILFNREAADSDYAMGLRLLNGTVSKNVYGFVTASNGLSSADITNRGIGWKIMKVMLLKDAYLSPGFCTRPGLHRLHNWHWQLPYFSVFADGAKSAYRVFSERFLCASS